MYRKNVAAIIINEKKQILVGHRTGFKPNIGWQLPQGGIHDDEDELKAIEREVKEETGIENCNIVAKTKELIKYNFPLEDKKYPGVPGQEQRYFLIKFEGDDSKILDHKCQEFDAFEWRNFERVINEIIPFKRNAYIIAFKEFENYFKKPS